MGRSKYSKSELFIMEFIVVVLFFAISASICISAFVRANNISEESLELNRGLTLAQSTAESMKASPEEFAEGESSFSNEEFFVRMTKQVEEQMMTGTVEVFVKSDVRKEICTLEVKKYLPGEV